MSSDSTEQKTINNSLLTAYSYLLQRLEREFDAAALRKHVEDLQPGEDAMLIVGLLDPKIQIVETGDYGTWPAHNNSVIKFQIQDPNEPLIDVNGAPAINIIDYYCIAADAGDHQVIDSDTGVIRNGNMYGQPVEWCTFMVGERVTAPEIPANENTYKVLHGGESAWDIARRLNINAREFIEHNDLDMKTAGNVEAGTVLHIPYVRPKPVVAQRRTVYEEYPEPRKMHVINEKGAKKMAFGNAKTLADINPTGPTYPHNGNVTIVAVAHVPVTVDGEEKTAGYLMDALAFGEYRKTGKVAWDIGFNHAHLAEGHDETAQTIPPRPQIEAKIIEASATAEAAKLAQAEAERTADMLANPEKYPNGWKSTYKDYPDGPRVFVADTDMIITNYENGRQRAVTRLQGILITGEFEVCDDEGNILLCGRPARGENSFHWFGVPMDLLTLESDLFALPPKKADLPTRVVEKGRLTIGERLITEPLSRHLNHPVIRRHVERLKIKL